MKCNPGSFPPSPAIPFLLSGSSSSVPKAFWKHSSLLFFCLHDFLHLQALNFISLHMASESMYAIWISFLSSQGARISSCLPHTSNWPTFNYAEKAPCGPTTMPWFKPLLLSLDISIPNGFYMLLLQKIPKLHLCYYPLLVLKSAVTPSPPPGKIYVP